jgi:hypothetical protein
LIAKAILQNPSYIILRSIRVKSAPRLVLLALVLVASLAVGVFGLTLLFSQTVPSTTIRQPASGVISSNCPALTPAKTVFDPGTSGNFSLTCNATAAFTVSSAGTFVPTFALPTGYINIATVDFNTYQQVGSCAVGGAAAQFLNSGTGIALSAGSYVYCVNYYIAPSSTSTSIPSFTINWNRP